MENIFGLILAIIFGAVFGSYATLFAYRLPRGESCFGRYFGPKSRCPKCGTTIRTRDLIPLLNWLFTLGRCRDCKTKIPRIHFFVELTTTVLFVICYLKFSFSENFIIYAMMSVGVVILMATDFTHKVFPQQILNFVLMVALANRVLIDQNVIDVIFSSAFGVVFCIAFYQVFYMRTNQFFANQNQAFDYSKFILVAAVAFPEKGFLLYFFSVTVILTMLLLLNAPTGRKRTSFGYALIIPFLWLMFCPPLIS